MAFDVSPSDLNKTDVRQGAPHHRGEADVLSNHNLIYGLKLKPAAVAGTVGSVDALKVPKLHGAEGEGYKVMPVKYKASIWVIIPAQLSYFLKNIQRQSEAYDLTRTTPSEPNVISCPSPRAKGCTVPAWQFRPFSRQISTLMPFPSHSNKLPHSEPDTT